ncbi:MAG: HEAT repeat domain-containing protein [Polyangiales bacterium]
MSLLSWFSKTSPEAVIKKHAARVANKRSYAPDRWDSIHALAALRSEAAVAALLPRFTYRVDPSITDQEEKDAVFRAIVDCGEVAVAPLRDALQRDAQIAWPLKCLEAVLSTALLCTELLALLAAMEPEYERDPQKKIQVIAALQGVQDTRIVTALQRFLSDPNETVRFTTVDALRAQANCSEAQPALLQLLKGEESVRVRRQLAEVMAQHAFDLRAEAAALRSHLPEGFVINAKGHVQVARR